MSSIAPSGLAGSTSYQPLIEAPPFIVIGLSGALGKMNFRGVDNPNRGTTGSKSVASAPSPCSQITVPFGHHQWFFPEILILAALSKSSRRSRRATLALN